MENRRPKEGEYYRHFKGNIYQILAIAKHSETMEELVIYKDINGEQQVYARPLDMFVSKVDKLKYPFEKQVYRFEKLEEEPQEEASDKQALLLEFLDTESAAERLAILQKMKGKVGQREIDSLCFCLDVKPMDGDLEMQLEHLKQYIRMQQRYDAPRLRWEE